MYRLFFANEVEEKKKFIVYFILLVLFDSTAIVTPLLLGYLVDYGLQTQNLSLLFGFGIVVIVFVIIRTLGSYFSVIQLDFSTFRIRDHRRCELYQKVHASDFSFFQQFHVGELINLINDDWDNVRRWFGYDLKTILFNIAHFVIALVFFLSCSIPVTLLFLGFIFLHTFFSFRFFQKVKHYYELLREKGANLSRSIQDFIDGSRVLKSFHAMGEEAESLMDVNSKIKQIDFELAQKRNRFMNFNHFFFQFLSILFVISVTYLFISGRVTIGEILILNSFIGYLQEPFRNLNEMLDDYQKAHTSKERLLKVLHYESKIKNQSKENVSSLFKPIQFQNVCVTLDEKEVLQNLNFTISPYETVAFIGLTGSGKSSIANLLVRFLNPTSGEIKLGSKTIEDYDLVKYRSKIGYVFQEPFLYSDTILNNIFFGSKYSKKKLEYLTKICRLDFVRDLKDGFQTVIGERGVGLSGGEKQRIALARALAGNPDLLILDDMTSALDIETEKSIIEAIYQMDKTCTKVIIAEKIVSVKNADMIYVMDDGVILESGTHEELLKKEGYYYQMYKIQRSDF